MKQKSGRKLGSQNEKPEVTLILTVNVTGSRTILETKLAVRVFLD